MENRFEKLEVWKEAHQYALEIYRVTKQFPNTEKYSLIDQLRRSASSVTTNIVEGNERQSTKEFVQFLYVAKASLAESQYQLMLARDLGYLDKESYIRLNDKSHELARLLNGLIKYLKKQ